MLKVNALCLGLLTLSLPLKADILNLTSLEWPPYASEGVEQQGASVAVVKAAVEAMGHELNVEFSLGNELFTSLRTSLITQATFPNTTLKRMIYYSRNP